MAGAREVLDAFADIERMRDIDEAEGYWLDLIGRLLGIDRPAFVTPPTDTRFGFAGSMGGTFDQAPFWTLGGRAGVPLSPLPDETFRRLIKARGLTVLSDGTFQTFYKAAKILDPDSSPTDNRNMMLTVVTRYRSLFELADDIGALPLNGGVGITYQLPS